MMKWEHHKGRECIRYDATSATSSVIASTTRTDSKWGKENREPYPYYYRNGDWDNPVYLPHLAGRPLDEIKAVLEGIIAIVYGDTA